VAAFILNTVQPGWNAIDAGAFAGYYTLLLSRLVSEDGVVHAFEPIPENYELLSRNIELNGRKNIKKNQLAVGSGDSLTSFRRSRQLYSPYGSLVLKDDPSRYESIPVSVRSIDSYLRDLDWPSISLVKVDVEAAEADIMAGMEQTIARFRPILVIEIHDRPAHDQERARRVLPMLFDWNYRLFCLEDDPDLTKPLSAPEAWSGEKHCIAVQ
jgi:FkbM family methyltransferase